MTKSYSPLITGSLAFDFILRIDGRFSQRTFDHAGFSAAFLAPELTRLFGGCAGNIAYGLNQLHDAPILMATVGEDSAPYRHYLRQCHIDDAFIKTIAGTMTAQAFIASDDDNSQVIIFHPGATDSAHEQSIEELPTLPPLAIVAPNGKKGMLNFARELAAAKVPFIFDPGQVVGVFNKNELNELTALCRVAIFNNDEYNTYIKICDSDFPIDNDTILIKTDGERGSEIYADGQCYQTAAVTLGEVADTTGCGDAYRAGIIYGIMREWTWRRIGQFASAIAGIKALHKGGQGYTTNSAQVNDTCQKFFG